MNSFYEKFKKLGKDELIKVVLSPDNYVPEAIEAARQVIVDNWWSKDLEESEKKQREIEEKEREAFEREVIEKADYYRKVAEIKRQDHFYFIPLTQISDFEEKLAVEHIDFYLDDKNMGMPKDKHPTQTYFFRHEDVEAVDQILREMGLITTPYVSARGRFKKELIILGLIILFAILAIVFLS